MMRAESGKLYRHIKTGGIYKVLMCAIDENSLLPVVVYEAQFGSKAVWVRPTKQFVDGRFEPWEANGVVFYKEANSVEELAEFLANPASVVGDAGGGP